MLAYQPISNFRPGDLSKMIFSSYAELVKNNPKIWGKEKDKWDDFDRQAFADPDIGQCIFVTCLGKTPIGLASWDPRQFPKLGIIGQNCILPEYQGKGFGKTQIKEVLRIFKKNKAKKAQVTTSSHPFFLPAQKMYKSLGFKEVDRRSGGPDPKYKLIDFEKIL